MILYVYHMKRTDIMAYARLLNELIEKSGLTAKDIAQKCTEQGQKITASYISILRNENSNRVPSEELSRVLEKVLNAEPQQLVIEAYIENAPEKLKQAIRNMMVTTVKLAIVSLGSQIKEEETEAIIAESLKKPYSTLVLSLADQSTNDIFNQNMVTSTEEIDGKQFNTKIDFNIDFEVKDDSMSPKLNKGDKVKLQTQNVYNNDDIVCYKTKSDDTMKYRKLYIKDNKTMLVPFNFDYEIEEYNKDEVTIIGKVTQIVRTL